MLNVAEAIVRVFHRLGDYQHKHKNRMKFLIKPLGWERWRDGVRGDARGRPRRGRRDAALRSATRRRSRRRPTGRARRRPRVEDIAARRRAAACAARASPAVQPIRPRRRRRYRRVARPTSGRRSRPATSLVVRAAALGDFTGEQMRILGDLARGVRRRHRAHHAGPEPGVPLGAAARSADALYARLAAAGLGAAGAPARSRDVTSCPGAESCKLAVTQSRGLARAGRASRARTRS